MVGLGHDLLFVDCWDLGDHSVAGLAEVGLVALDVVEELVEQRHCVQRATLCLWVELR